MNMKKTIAATVCAGMVVVGSVAGTMAYFTDTTQELDNVMTVGQVDISLDENNLAGEGRTTTGNTYHLMPGSTYAKNPVVYVEKGSEETWLFVKVTDSLATALTDADAPDVEVATTNGTIAQQIEGNGWTALAGNPGVYYRVAPAVANDAANKASYTVFEDFKINSTLTNAQMAQLANKEIKIQAYAIQKDNIETAAAAWTALQGN